MLHCPREVCPVLAIRLTRPTGLARRVASRLAMAVVIAGMLALAGMAMGAPRALAAASTPSWVPINPVSRPPARSLSVAAYDPGTKQFVLFGGGDGQFNPTNDTWLWNGLSWSAAKPTTAPPARFGATMAYDAATGQLLLFGGGAQNVVYFADTWTWNGSNWVQLHPATSPPANLGMTMAYDPATKQIVLFGGQQGTTYSNSTWVWTGTNWVQLHPAAVPPARQGAAMAWDPATSQLIMFGGRQTGSVSDFNDTWVWTGTNWVQQHPAASPAARSDAVLAFDPDTGQMLLAGGVFSGTEQVVNDVWTWSGSTWTQQAPAQKLPPRAGAVAGYDAATKQLLVFGGVEEGFMALGDTWLWSTFTIFEQSLPAGTVGLPYPGTVDAIAGTGTVTLSVSSGTLPPGLSLTQDGALSGTPQTPGSFSFTVSAVDSAGHSASRAYTVTINASPRAGVWVSDGTNSVLRAFALGAHGNIAPSVTLGGTLSQLNGPDGLVLDSNGGLYVANGNTASVNYYTAGASGNVAPARVLSGPFTGLGVPMGMALDANGRLYVANSAAGTVTVYPPGAAGNQVPSQTIGGLLTGLHQPSGVTVDAAGHVWVSDLANNSLLEFAAGATGDVPPLEKITGPDTLLASPIALAQDSRGRLLVSNLYGQSVTEYANAQPFGDAFPVWRILGDTAQLNNPAGLDVDAADDLYVGNEFGGVNEYLPNTVTPTGTISGTATGLRSPRALAVAPPTQIVTRSLPPAALGRRYQAGLFAVLDRRPPRWRIVGGSLPSGLRLGRSGHITGVPRRLGSATFTVQIANALPKRPPLHRRLRLTVRRAPTVTAVTPARGSSRGGVGVTITGSGFATRPGHTTVHFGRITASRVRCRSHTRCTVRLPAHPTARVAVTITVAGLTSAPGPGSRFTYIRR